MASPTDVAVVTTKSLTGLDIGIIAIYFVIIFGIGVYFARKGRSSVDYFLAGRNVGWFAIGASLFVSNISTEHFIGLAGSGATSGLAVGHFEWLACLILLILGWVFVPFYLRSNVFTMPEFLERRFNRSCSVYLASISILAYIFTKISVHLYAAAIVLERVVGWDPMTAAIALVVATGIYTIIGGLSAVIYTELMQTLVLLAGAVILTVIGLSEVGGFGGLRAAVPEHYFSMMKPADHPEFPWTGIFLGAPILGIWYWCTDQVIVQRVLSAKDEGHAKAGTIFAGFLKILPVFVLVLPGLIAFALYPQLFTTNASGTVTNGDIAYPTLIVNLLPSGLVGLMVAALLAALMGGMASVFNSASTLVTLDFYKRVRPAASETAAGVRGPYRHRRPRRARTAVGAVHQAAQLAALHLSAVGAGLHQSADRGVLHPRHPVDAAERRRRDQHAVDRSRARHAAVRAGSAGQEQPLRRRGRALAARHELPALRDPDVRDLFRRADPREPAHACTRPPQARGSHVRHCR